MTRKITTILLALALCLTLLPVGAGAAGTTSGSYTLTSNDSNQLLYNDNPVASTSKNDWVAWEYNDSGNPSKYINDLSGYVLNDGTYYLNSDVTITQPLIIQGGTKDNPVTLDLNGNVLKYNGTDKNSVIVVTSGAYFKLVGGSNASHTLHYTVDADGKWTFGSGDNTITLTGGIITGGTGSDCSYTASNLHITQYYGGGVFVGRGATFEMTGGNIVGCSVSSAANGYNLGGGVYMGSNATFEMTGSSIVGCSSIQSGGFADGGGVYAPGGASAQNGNKVTITDSSIIGCTASGQGGGVYVGNNSSLTVTNSSITSCTAKQGGGVFFGGGGATFTMEGSSTISGCKATEGGNGVYLQDGTMDAQGGIVYGSVCLYNNQVTLTNTSETGSTIFYANKDGDAIGKALADDGISAGAGKIEGKRVKFMNGTTLYAETIAKNDGNGKISKPDDPTDEGKHLAGWYTQQTDGTEWIFDTKTVSDDMTLYAHWHTLTNVPAKAAAIGVAGNIEYWYCNECGKCFSDANGTKPTTLKEVTLDALPHRTYRVSTEPIESPKTADIGVALYAVMALTSCTGTALVIRGRKRK